MPSRFSSRRRLLLVVLVVTSLLLITLDVRGSRAVDTVRGVAVDAFSPVRSVADVVFGPFENIWHGVFDYPDVKKENAELQAEIERQRGAALAAEAQVREYQELRAINDLDTVGDIPTVTAQVVGLPASNFELTVELDKGSNQGIKVGMPVVNTGGLVGRVAKVTPTRSIVRLITDPELDVGVKINPDVAAVATTVPGAATTLPGSTVLGTTLPGPPTGSGPGATPAVGADVATPSTTGGEGSTTSGPTTTGTTTTLPGGSTTVTTLPPTGSTIVATTVPTTRVSPQEVIERGVLHGQGKGRDLAVDYIGADAPVREGDAVVTSGVRESLMPPDIPVGRVSVVRRNAGSTQLVVRVQPSANLDRLNFVKVLLWQPSE